MSVVTAEKPSKCISITQEAEPQIVSLVKQKTFRVKNAFKEQDLNIYGIILHLPVALTSVRFSCLFKSRNTA